MTLMLGPEMWRGLRWPLAILLLYLLLAVIATYPLTLEASDHVFGLGTPPLNIWAMAWVNHQLPRDPLHLFDGNAFYPYPRSLAFSEHLFVPSLLAAPWIALTGNALLAHNAVALLSLGLAGLGMYLFCHELTRDKTASFIAGALYAFHSWNINELIRIQILSNQWFPFFLWTVLRFFRRPSPRRAAAVGVMYALQSLSCMYWALYLPLAAGLGLAFLQWRHRLAPRRLLPLAVSLGCALALTLLFFVPYLQNSQELGSGRELPNSVPVDRYFDVLQGNWLYEDWLGTARVNENAAHFVGFSAIALGLLGLLAKTRANEGDADGVAELRPWLLVFVAVGFVLSLGPEIRLWDRVLGPGPYRLLFEGVPGFQSVRYPERFSIFLILGLCPLVARGLVTLRPRVKHAGLTLVGVFVFLEHLSVPIELAPLPSGRAIPEVYRALANRDDVHVVAEVPATRHWGERADADAMYFSTVHWKRTVQGFTGYFPPAYNFIRWRLFHFPDPTSLAFLEKLGVDTVVMRRPLTEPTPEAGERFTLEDPFPEGHRLLRLRRARLQFDPPSDSTRSLRELDRATFRVHGSSPGAELVKDGDPGTAWSTVDLQREHHFFAMRFPNLERPALVSMLVGPPFEFPMRFEVLGLFENGEWGPIAFDRERAYDRFFAQLLHRPREARFDIELDAQPVRELRLRITETDPFEMPWSFSELFVYESIDAH